MDDPRSHLVPGREYDVHLEDCCISGDLRGCFLRAEPEIEDGEIIGYEYWFDFGWIGPEWSHKWKATERKEG